jgi:RNA polymerase sigma-70 factor, ECF subfamily
MRDMTLSEVERLGAAAGEADEAFQMDEDTFRVFYERTAHSLWAYLSRMTGDARLADDLLQETYYRFLRAAVTHDSEAHRRNYLFRIATNLVYDHRRHVRPDGIQMSDAVDSIDRRPAADVTEGTVRRLDLARAMAHLKPRERHLLWLAYAHGSSHQEIADTLGLKRSSIKLLLFRARRRLAALLRNPRPAHHVADDSSLAETRLARASEAPTRNGK